MQQPQVWQAQHYHGPRSVFRPISLTFYRQVGPSLLQLQEEGYDVIVVGHSLGAGGEFFFYSTHNFTCRLDLPSRSVQFGFLHVTYVIVFVPRVVCVRLCSVAALLVHMLAAEGAIPGARAVLFGCPSCVDAALADSLRDR